MVDTAHPAHALNCLFYILQPKDVLPVTFVYKRQQNILPEGVLKLNSNHKRVGPNAANLSPDPHMQALCCHLGLRPNRLQPCCSGPRFSSGDGVRKKIFLKLTALGRAEPISRYVKIIAQKTCLLTA